MARQSLMEEERGVRREPSDRGGDSRAVMCNSLKWKLYVILSECEQDGRDILSDCALD